MRATAALRGVGELAARQKQAETGLIAPPSSNIYLACSKTQAAGPDFAAAGKYCHPDILPCFYDPQTCHLPRQAAVKEASEAEHLADLQAQMAAKRAVADRERAERRTAGAAAREALERERTLVEAIRYIR